MNRFKLIFGQFLIISTSLFAGAKANIPDDFINQSSIERSNEGLVLVKSTLFTSYTIDAQTFKLSSQNDANQVYLPKDAVIQVLEEGETEDGTNFLLLKSGDITFWVKADDLKDIEVLISTEVAANGYITPVKGRITSRPGMRRHPISRRMKYHAGTDIAAPTGTPVKAAAQGKVAFAGWAGGYGKAVYLNHTGGAQTRYAHMSAILVRGGQSVVQSQVIGKVGSTGNSTGPHLHFEQR